MFRTHVIIIAVGAALLSACSGGGGASNQTVPGAPGLSSGTITAAPSLYTIRYIPPDPGCLLGQEESVVISPTGVVGGDEFCGKNYTPTVFIDDHGQRTQLPFPVLYIFAINSHKHATVQEGDGRAYLYDINHQTSTALQGGQPADIGLNDADYSAGTVGINCNEYGCQSEDPAKFSPTGSYQLLSQNSGNGIAINAGGTVLVSSNGGYEADLYEPQGKVDVNTVINQPLVEAGGLNDSNHVALAAGPGTPGYPGQLKPYLYTGTSTPIAIPQDASGGTMFPTKVNNNDEVVGASCTSLSETSCIPWVYERSSGKTQDLSAVAAGFVPAPNYSFPANNNKGEIVVGATHNGQTELALLVPIGCVNP